MQVALEHHVKHDEVPVREIMTSLERMEALPIDAVERILDATKHFPPGMKASMALDLDRGNRLEVPWLSGKVAELGRQFGIATPTHSMMHAMLKPYAMGSKG